MKYDANPDRCEVLVTASSTATAGRNTVTIYAYNEIGESKTATLTVNIVEDSSQPAPLIDDENISVDVIPGGMSFAILTGRNIASWAYKDLPSAIKAIEMSYYNNDPNICGALITASSTAEIGEYTVTFYAYNSVGMSADVTLTVSVLDPDSDAVRIEFTRQPKSADVIPGGTSSSVFTAKNVLYWRHDGNLPSIVKAVEFRYNYEDPGECEVIITASSTAKIGDTASINILAGNIYDEIPSTINVTIASTAPAAPKITPKTAKLALAPGMSATTTFTGANASTWKYGNLPDCVSGIGLVYDPSSPDICEVTVTASSFAYEDDSGDIVITAYNSAGVSADATLTVTIDEDGESGDDPAAFLNSHSSGCDMGFAGLSLLALSMIFLKAKSKK